MSKFVYSFTEGDGKNKKLLGGKGANLCEMTQIGINVPPGFVITTEACLEYLDGDKLPDSFDALASELWVACSGSVMQEAAWSRSMASRVLVVRTSGS